MTFPAIIIHFEIEFDSMGVEPSPWWRPFFWVRNHRDGTHRQDVVRFGALGLHICFSAAHHADTDEARTPKEGP